MDKEQEELQSLGIFRIWTESFKVFFKWRGIFLLIALSFTLPLTNLGYINISFPLLQFIILSLSTISTKGHTDAYNTILHSFSRKLRWYTIISQIAHIVFQLIFFLLSTSAIVYIVACIYSCKKVSFKEVMYVVPKIWKKLMVTFLCSLVIVLVYNFVFGFIAIMLIIILGYPINSNKSEKIWLLGVALCILYLAGLCYMGLIWQLANIVSILEESIYGFKALWKSKSLMKGKMGIYIVIILVVNLFVGGALNRLFNRIMELAVDQSTVFGMLIMAVFGFISLAILSFVILLGFVVHVVFYFVCKSYHHEHIDKSALADHLEAYHGEGSFVLKPKDLQHA